MKKSILALTFLLLILRTAFAQQVSTLAGTGGQFGYQDAFGSAVRFNAPTAVASDQFGNVYIADRLNHRIRRCTPSGQVTTVAGSGLPGATDGPALSASFYEPSGIACDTLGNIYVTDTRNYKIRKISAGGLVTTLAGVGVFGVTDGPATFARFGFPVGIAVSPDGNTVFVSDYNTHTIRRLRNDTVSTIAGAAYFPGTTDGTGSLARFDHPSGLALSSTGMLYICDEWNNRIRTLSLQGQVVTIAGIGVAGHADGPAAQALFNHPSGICIDGFGFAFIADAQNEVVRKLSIAANSVSTYVGGVSQPGWIDGTMPAPRFSQPVGVAFDRINRRLLVVEAGNHVLRRCEQISSVQLTLSLNNPVICAGATSAVTVLPSGLTNYSLTLDGAPVAGGLAGVFQVSGLTAGTHTLIAQAIDANGAVASSSPLSIQVAAAVQPTIISTAPNGLCPGASALLTASGAINYVWSTGTTGASIQVSQPGTYTVTATAANGCSGSAATNVLALTAPSVQVTASADTICAGAVSILSASGAASYLWSTAASTASIQASAGTYTVTGTNTNGCTSISASVTIHSYPSITPAIAPGGPVVLLQGESISLQATGLIAYQWSTGSTNSSISVNQAGIYSVSGTTPEGCTSGLASIQVTIITPAQLLQVNAPTDFCEGDSLLLQSAVTAGNQWYVDGAPIAGATTSTFYAQVSGVYSVSVLRNGQWYSSNPVTVTVFPTPENPTLTDSTICSGTSVLITIDSIPTYQYNWYSPADSTTVVSSTAAWISPVLEQTSQWRLTIISPQGCINNQAGLLTIYVEEAPQPDFNHTIAANGSGYNLSCIYTGAVAASYTWSLQGPSGLVYTSTLQNPVFQVQEIGQYTIHCVATSTAGCTNELVRQVYIGPVTKPFVPTTFTPNGDGRNDIFRLRGEQFKVIQLDIIDQWGTAVFSGQTEWDGRCADGTIRNASYLYRFRFSDANQQIQELTGTVTVVQ